MAPPPSPPPIEPDPFKNARGLAGMFGRRRGGGPPLWPFLIAAVGVIAVILLRIQLAGEARRQKQMDLELSRQLQQGPYDYGRSPFASTGAQISPDGFRPTDGPGRGAISRTQLETKVVSFCERLAACRPGTDDPTALAGCVSEQLALADDPDMRVVLSASLDDVEARCGDEDCDGFQRCYLARLRAQMGEEPPPAGPASAGPSAGPSVGGPSVGGSSVGGPSVGGR